MIIRSLLSACACTLLLSCSGDHANKLAHKTLIKGDLSNAQLIGPVKSDTEITYKYAEKDLHQEAQPEHTTIKTFDNKGNITVEISYGKFDSLIEKWVYKYDENGRRSEADRYDHRDIMVLKELGKYNKEGKNTEQYICTPNGQLIEKDVYIINDDGNKVEEDEFDDNGKIECKKNNKYDDNGNLISVVTKFTDRKLRNELTYAYDEKRNMNEMRIYFGSVIAIWTYSFENYDKAGNWLKNTCCNNKKLESTTQRKIGYY